MKIRVVGCGWFGSHITLSLLKYGHDVTAFDRADRLFNGASGANQSRLHLGFHYPRCSYTRNESIDNFHEFMENYYHLTKVVEINIYGIAELVSLIDYSTYRDIMRSSGNEFLEIDPQDYGLFYLEGAMLTRERLINQNFARKWFSGELNGHFILNHSIDSLYDDKWDLTIDCTFGAFDIHPVEWVEPCIMMLFEGPTNRAVTIMDGPEGVSVYPFDDRSVSLTSVSETPLERCKTMWDARKRIELISQKELTKIHNKMVDRITRYMPDFTKTYKYLGNVMAPRVKPISASDRRSTVINHYGKVITVFPGKISGVFDAERKVKEIIGQL